VIYVRGGGVMGRSGGWLASRGRRWGSYDRLRRTDQLRRVCTEPVRRTAYHLVMSVSLARQSVSSAQKELERCREKQAAEEKKAAALDKEADAKQRSASSTSSASMRGSYITQAARKGEEATAARGRAARHAADAAKAQKKVHDAEARLRAEEQREAKKLADRQSAADKKTTLERERADRVRDTARRHEVAGLRTRIEEQEKLLASAPWQQVPETITVLFIASSPEDQDGLRIDKEMREIQQRVRLADHRDALRFEYAVAAQPSDLLQRLNEVKPDVVHFSGHSDAAGLAMEDNDGLTRVLATDELATLLSVSSRRIRLAVFNSCESADHAAVAVRHLDAAIGMEQSIGDAAAQSFAGQLYSSIAFGLPLCTAFNQAVLQVRFVVGKGSGEPQLFVARDLDGDQLVLVQPVAAPS
jgi:hypothetical protein